MRAKRPSALVLALLLAPLLEARAEQATSKLFNFNFKHTTKQLIVKFKEQITAQDFEQLTAADGKIEHTFANHAHLVAFPSIDSEEELASLARELASSPQVAYVEANSILKALDTTPNDPRLSELWGIKKIAATKAWDSGTTSKAALVAIIDTGLDRSHPDIAANAWQNPGETGKDAQGRDKASNKIDDDANGFIDDWRGWDFANNDNDPTDDNRHGTHCAGTIGAVGNNKLGVVGVSWQASLVGIKFLDAQGSGTLSDAIKAIDYGVKIGASVLSNSWGGGGFSQTMEDAIRRADSAGSLFVAAAGNAKSDNDQAPHYPSGYQVGNVVAVAATDANDVLANFSQYGLKTVHLAAPGHNILSTTPTSTYGALSGTSMATPHVAGAAALLRAQRPSLSVAQVKDKLLQSTDPVSGLFSKVSSGGRLNLYNLLEKDSTPPAVVTGLEVNPVGLSSLSLRFDPSGDDGLEGKAVWYVAKTASLPITTEGEWLSAQTVRLLPNQDNTYTASGLASGSEGFISVKARDNAGNFSSFSESVAFSLPRVRAYAYYPGDSLNEVDVEAPWGLQQQAGESFFSDSPVGKYKSNTNASLYLKPLALANPDAVLSFDTFYETENRFDYLVVEISWDAGTNWIEAQRLTGASGTWLQKTIPLRAGLAAPNGSSELRVRFRFVSDYSLVKEGVQLDNIKIFAAE